MEKQPKKKINLSTKGLIILIILGFIVYSIISANNKSIKNSNVSSNSNNTTTKITSSTEQKATPTTEKEPDPISLNGTGQEASAKFQLEKGLAIFKMTYNGTSNFIVDLLDNSGKSVDGSLVNEIGNFTGSKALNINKAGTYIFDISADGTWTIKIEQPRLSSALTTVKFGGKGQQSTALFSLKNGLKTIKMTHDGKSNFIVDLLKGDGKSVDGSLVNEIGNFTGSKAIGIQEDGIYLFDINADGNWTITIE